MDLGRSHSFAMDEHEDFNLDDTFFGDDDGADLGSIFEGDGDPLNDVTTPSKYSLDITKLSPDIDDTGEDKETKSSTGTNRNKARGKDEKEKGGTQKGKKRRRSNLSVGGACGVIPPAWHNQVADKHHREAMFKEIAQLLKDRKKTAPTKEWMKQLPHKARVLEEGLYKGAPSLESYLDRSTLKNRLRKLAVTITKNYQQAAGFRKHSKTGHQSSFSVSNPAINYSHRGSMSSTVSMNGPAKASVNERKSSVKTPTNPMSVPSNAATTNGRSPGALVAPEDAVSGLTKQKAANEQLQRQILQNIRQQQQLVHSDGRGSDASVGNTSYKSAENNGIHGNSMAGIQGSPPALNQRGNQFAHVPNCQMYNMQNGNQMNMNMLGNQMNGMQGNQFANMQGGMMNHGGPNMSGMGGQSFPEQASLMRHSSVPNAASMAGPNNLSQAQMALMRQRSMPMYNGSNGMNMENAQGMQANMQANMMGRGPGNSADAQAMQMRRMSNPHTQHQDATRAQMQAAMMGQNSVGNDQFNAAQRQAYMMQQNSGPMGPQSAAQAEAAMMRQMSGSNQFNQFDQSTNNAMQAEMMRRASHGNNSNFPVPGVHGPHAMMVNQQMANNGTTRLPNGQVVPTHVLQSNPTLLQQMNAGGEVGQTPHNMQQQMGMGPQGRNSFAGDGNAGGTNNKTNGDDAWY